MKGVTSVYRIVNNNGNPKIQYNNINTSGWVDFAEVGGGRADTIKLQSDLVLANTGLLQKTFITK